MNDLEARFAGIFAPLLARNDVAGALAALRGGWKSSELKELLGSSDAEIVRLAVSCLGFVGKFHHSPYLVEKLHHADARVTAAAENALWSVWMRAGSKAANAKLATAVRYLGKDDVDGALSLLDDLCDEEPDFSEAHHQRAIALHSQDRLHEAEQAYREVIAGNPFHFSALAALGHLNLERDDFDSALRCYREALTIHPRLPELHTVVEQLETVVNRRVVA